MAEPVYEAGAWVYKMLITLAVAVVALGIVGYSVKQEVNVRDVQARILLERFLYSPDGIWYQTPERSYTGIIDARTLADYPALQERLDKAFQYPDGYGALRVSVIRLEQTDSRSIYGTVTIGKATWQALAPRIEAGTQGIGIYEQHSYPVTVRSFYTDTQYVDTPALLRVELVVPQRA